MDYRKMAEKLFYGRAGMPRKKYSNKVDDVTHGEMGVLGFLSFNGDGVTSGYISEKAVKTTARIANILNSLEKKGFIHREMDSSDRRKINVFLTDSGRAFELNRRTEAIDDLEDKLKFLGEADAAEYVRIMERLMKYNDERDDEK